MDLFMRYGLRRRLPTEALADAGIEEGTVASDRMGVVVGTAMSGGIDHCRDTRMD